MNVHAYSYNLRVNKNAFNVHAYLYTQIQHVYLYDVKLYNDFL